ncbi:helix-turn-helix domain-containing protein [Neptuniibacter sp.]|uniref:helix-turn-helix domain-containing protein n=1 Tax=Neptuniibacter sp. TaxID=1962643 RepID=UPI003B58BF72
MRYSNNSRAYDQLTSWLKQLREEKGIATSQLAEMLEVSPSIISKIENNHRKIDAFELVRYAKALGVSAEEVAVRIEKIIEETNR